MKYPLITLTKFGLLRAKIYACSKRPYLMVGFTSYLIITLIIVLYLHKTPSFTSDMEIVLPGTGSSNSFSLDSVGQVTSQTDMPFSGGGFNPRVNYKEMLSSRSVRSRAAKKLKISFEDFGKPRIKLAEQTSIISLVV
jgi:uncharacterized protein involved in exopolysaccharide biosynthesis